MKCILFFLFFAFCNHNGNKNLETIIVTNKSVALDAPRCKKKHRFCERKNLISLVSVYLLIKVTSALSIICNFDNSKNEKDEFDV